jgi:bacteriocin-like protein
MLMKYKDFKTMSIDEMKNVRGGDPTWTATCTHPYIPGSTCYDSIAMCHTYCNIIGGYSCSLNWGSEHCDAE